MKRQVGRIFITLVILMMTAAVYAQDTPYREDGWAKLPDGRKLGHKRDDCKVKALPSQPLKSARRAKLT